MMLLRIAFILALLTGCAQAQMWPFPGPGQAAISTTYVGPGDVVSGAKAWHGLRAYSSADRGNRLVNVCDSTGGVDNGTCVDLISDATTGALVPQSNIGTNLLTCPGSANCTIKTFYDRSGANSCTSGTVACDVTQTTVSKRATFQTSCIGSLACARFTSANSQEYRSTVTLPAQSQPFWISWSGQRISGTNEQIVYMALSVFTGVGFRNAASSVEIYAGTAAGATATDAAFHAVQGFFNGASASSQYVDGTLTGSLSPGTNSFGTGFVSIGNNSFTAYLNGYFLEAGIWSGNQTASNAAMNSNQHSYWGF